MKYVLAISGGVDSVVLLDIAARARHSGFMPESNQCEATWILKQVQNDGVEFVVAHFDHGIRAESGRDAKLVQRLAKKYGFEFVLGEADLGKDASEDAARAARYKFLRSIVAGLKPAKIVTAHHQDDLLETILMNIFRGTNWRGLAPMWAGDIERPLLGKSKAELVAYAIKNKLEWSEDETNYSPKYFRNRVRVLVQNFTPQQRRNLLALHVAQAKLRTEIENILEHNFLKMGTVPNLRKDVIVKMPEDVAIEVLRKWTGEKLTYPQLQKLYKDIKNASGGIDIQPGGKIVVNIKKNVLSIKKLTTNN